MSRDSGEWRTAKELHGAALDRFCARILAECRAILDDESGTNHERYLRLYRLIHDRDDEVAGAFNDFRRSLFVRRLATIHLTEPLTDEELGRLSPRTRENVLEIAELFR